MKIGYQGIKGSYSETALIEVFGENNSTQGYDDFYEVHKALLGEEIDLAFLPVQNSTAGTIPENQDFLYEEEVEVIGEYKYEVKHTLIGIKKSTIQDIQTVISHPQALRQCKNFLQQHKIKAKTFYDTAGAARKLTEINKKEIGAIASKRCTEIYDLEILAEEIQTIKNNTTKFYIVKKKNKKLNEPQPITKKNQGKILIAFKTKNKPGALLKCLEALALYEINMTKLESRPNPQEIWEYIFYIDLDMTENEKDLEKGLEIVKDLSVGFKIIGRY